MEIGRGAQYVSGNDTEIIRRRYDRTALFYDCMDKMLSPDLRQKAVSLAYGQVLEVGVGTGSNLPLYPSGCQVTAIDFSAGMLKKAQQKLKKAKMPVTVMQMDAENMSFADDTFDTVLATCVFCSVPNPLQGLREIRRVCKPHGKVILLEHVRSENPVLGKLMDF